MRCDVIEGNLRIAGPGVLEVVPLSAIEPEPPVGGGARVLGLPGDAQLRTTDHAAVDALFPASQPIERLVHRIERRWAAVLASVLAVALFSWWMVVSGLPAAATFAASLVPRDLEARLGAHTFESIEKGLCQASTLDAARQDALQKRFETLAAGLGDGFAYRLQLRDCRIGANAFALPGGTIVMTDDLVKLAGTDDEISAVLAHEIGHVHRQHGLRLALQAAGLAALTAALFGDAVSITSLATTLPAILLQSGYSRGLESEADEYAFVRLKQVGISPVAFADIMERMSREHGEAKDDRRDYFSTHPATAKRIERAREAAR